MTKKEIGEQLLKIAPAHDFARSSAELTEAWSKESVGLESVDATLDVTEAQRPQSARQTPRILEVRNEHPSATWRISPVANANADAVDDHKMAGDIYFEILSQAQQKRN